MFSVTLYSFSLFGLKKNKIPCYVNVGAELFGRIGVTGIVAYCLVYINKRRMAFEHVSQDVADRF